MLDRINARTCTLCKLHATAEFPGLLGQGPIPSSVMIVGEAPGHREDDTGKPFVGKAGELLIRLIREECGWDRDDVFITNAVSCRPPDNRTPSKREIITCKKWLDHQIQQVKPKFILLLGNTPLFSLLGVTGIKKHRGRPVTRGGIVYLPTVHPSATFYDPALESYLRTDLKFFKEIVQTGKVPEEENLNYTIVNDFTTADDMLANLEGDVSFDVETTGLYPWSKNASVVSLGLGTAKHQWCIPISHPESEWGPESTEYLLRRIGECLKDCYIIAHNGKFDTEWIYVHYGHKWLTDFDTMLADYALDENRPHGLKGLAQLYFGAPDWEITKTEKQGIDVPLERHCRYLAHDLYYTRRLWQVQRKRLARDTGVQHVFNKILMPCARLFVDVEMRGFYVDTKRMDEVEVKLKADIAEADQELKKYGDINWASPKQVGDLFFKKLKLPIIEKTKKGAASTSESVIKRLNHPSAQALLKYRGAKQQLSFFIDGWKPYLVGSRIHPSFKLHGTVTGRFSCEHPNLQQVPRDPLIRSLIGAPRGYTLLEVDLSQIELRIAAELSGERTMLSLFSRGIDIHWSTMLKTLTSASEDNIELSIRTVEMFIMRIGLPPDGTSAEVLLRVWKTNQESQEKSQFSSLPNSTQYSQTTGSGVGGVGSDQREQSELARRFQKMAKQQVSKEALRELRDYEKRLLASQGREPKKLERIQLDHALQILSCIGPSIAQELRGEWKELRKKAKAISFGFLYGMWHKKFQTYARDNYDIIVSEQEAQESRTSFFILYKDLVDWHKRQKSFARRNGYVRSLSGRKRRLPDAMATEDSPARGEAERQAINSPVQSFANEINLMMALQIESEFPQPQKYIVGTVHDAILMEVRDDYLRRVHDRLLEIARRPQLFADFDINLSVPIEAEAKVGPWGLGKELK